MKKVLLISLLSILFLSVKSQVEINEPISDTETLIGIIENGFALTVMDAVEGKVATMVYNQNDKSFTHITETSDATYLLASVRNDSVSVSSTIILGTSAVPFYEYILNKVTKVITVFVKGIEVFTVNAEGETNYPGQ